MAVRTLTLDLPDFLYKRVERTAQSLQRPVEDVLIEAVSTALPPLADLPQQIADDLASLAFLDDASLWQVARRDLSLAHHAQMDDLLARKGQDRLTAAEQRVLDGLLLEYQQLILQRAQAAVLLQRRGYDLSDPSVLNSSL